MAGPAMAAVVVAYRSEASLTGTLEALRAQLGDEDELVVVDNASPDASAAVARATAPEAHVIRLARNEGFGAGCHAGARASRSPLLLFVNPDARVQDGCVEALRATAAERPDWGAWQALVLQADGRTINTAGGVIHWLGIAWSGACDRPVAEAPARPAETAFASGAAFVVRRDAWEAVGGFDASYFMYYEDVDLSQRLRLAGWRIGVVPAARVRHDYAFVKGDYKWFALERNRWSSLIATYPGRLLLLVAPALVAFDLALLAVAARGGWLGAKLRAQAAVVRALPRLLRRRAAVQRDARVGAAEFASFLTASLDSPYLGGVASVPAAGAAQAAYWRLVTAFVRRSGRG